MSRGIWVLIAAGLLICVVFPLMRAFGVFNSPTREASAAVSQDKWWEVGKPVEPQPPENGPWTQYQPQPIPPPPDGFVLDQQPLPTLHPFTGELDPVGVPIPQPGIATSADQINAAFAKNAASVQPQEDELQARIQARNDTREAVKQGVRDALENP